MPGLSGDCTQDPSNGKKNGYPPANPGRGLLFRCGQEKAGIRRRKKLSTIDCVGYAVANRLNVPFLTGDREFADMDNVQFVR